ncbi:MAG: Gfo/Idh/MocA family oxidoreductase [Bacteroidia bacterium]|nr:Gfo/Idh/MocA family oxidoreductase [Bacteroidia bacterium]
MSNFNWAILAPGHIANNFIQDLSHVDDANVIAVASRSLDRAKAFADQYAIPTAVGSYEELLKIPDIDCVYVASPHVFHFEHTMMCLEAGLHVLCEKPFAMDSEEVDQMIQKAKENDVFLMEAMWTRFFPWTEQVLQKIEDGAIGDILSLQADFGFHADYNPEGRVFNKILGGGALLDIGIYPVFAALLFLGYPDEVTAKGEIGPTGVDHEVDIRFSYKNGGVANLRATLIEDTMNECIIKGTKGRIEVDPRFHQSKGYRIFKDNSEQQIDCGFEGKGFRWEIAHVQQCIKSGLKESPLMTFEFSSQLIQILDWVRQEIGLSYP